MTDTTPNLASALAAFQAELPRLAKDETAKVKGQTQDGRAYDRSYKYADLAQVVETVLPILGKHGLSITSKTTFTTSGVFMLEVTLLHASGEEETGFWPLPTGPKVGPQDVGSAMTYGRRYLTLALSGTYPGGEDDDGAQAQKTARESWDDARPNRERPVSAPPAPAEPVFTDEIIAGYQDKITTEPDLDMAVKGYDWMASKGVHNRSVPTAGAEDVLRTATEVLAMRISAVALDQNATVEQVKKVQKIANERGMLKLQVSATETLADVLLTAQELAQHAAAEQSKADTPRAEDS